MGDEPGSKEGGLAGRVDPADLPQTRLKAFVMTGSRQFVVWMLAAAVATALLVMVLLRQHESRRARGVSISMGEPRLGMDIFKRKGCIRCHDAGGVRGRVASMAREKLPRGTTEQLVTSMWNHAPRMWARMQEEGFILPNVSEEEMGNLFAFFHGTRTLDTGGSPSAGKRVFRERGCSDCHGTHAEGTPWGPTLREGFTSITLATELWHHGPNMYERTQEMELPWPTLAESDVSDILAFLNSHPEGIR